MKQELKDKITARAIKKGFVKGAKVRYEGKEYTVFNNEFHFPNDWMPGEKVFVYTDYNVVIPIYDFETFEWVSEVIPNEAPQIEFDNIFYQYWDRSVRTAVDEYNLNLKASEKVKYEIQSIKTYTCIVDGLLNTKEVPSFTKVITQEQFDIIEFLGSKKLDKEFNTVYTINELEFKVTPYMGTVD